MCNFGGSDGLWDHATKLEALGKYADYGVTLLGDMYLDRTYYKAEGHW